MSIKLTILAQLEQVAKEQKVGLPPLSDSLVLLARVYRSTGRFANALALAQEALAVRKMALGERHPAYADALQLVAEVYSDQGKYREARPLLESALEVRRTVLGERHPACFLAALPRRPRQLGPPADGWTR